MAIDEVAMNLNEARGYLAKSNPNDYSRCLEFQALDAVHKAQKILEESSHEQTLEYVEVRDKVYQAFVEKNLRIADEVLRCGNSAMGTYLDSAQAYAARLGIDIADKLENLRRRARRVRIRELVVDAQYASFNGRHDLAATSYARARRIATVSGEEVPDFV